MNVAIPKNLADGIAALGNFYGVSTIKVVKAFFKSGLVIHHTVKNGGRVIIEDNNGNKTSLVLFQDKDLNEK